MLGSPAHTPHRRLAGIIFAIALAGMCLLTVSSSLADSAAQTAAPRISIDVRDMETCKVIETIAQKGRQNILVSDRISGKITVKLQDMTWREALEIVMQSQGLVARQSGNVTLVDVAN